MKVYYREKNGRQRCFMPDKFLRPQCCKSRILEDSTDNCIIVPTIALYYREKLVPRNKRVAFSSHQIIAFWWAIGCYALQPLEEISFYHIFGMFSQDSDHRYLPLLDICDSDAWKMRQKQNVFTTCLRLVDAMPLICFFFWAVFLDLPRFGCLYATNLVLIDMPRSGVKAFKLLQP